MDLEKLTKPQLVQIIKTYNKELKIAFTNRTKQELIDIIKSFMNVYEGYIETKPKKLVTEKKKPKKVKDSLDVLIGQRGALRGEIEKYKSELEDMNEELKYDLNLKKNKSFVDKYKQKIKDVNKLILMLKEVNKQISKLEVKPKVKEDIRERIKRDEERYKKEDEKHQEMLKLIEKTDKLVKQKPKEQPKKKPKEDKLDIKLNPKDKYYIKDSEQKKPIVKDLTIKNLNFKNVHITNLQEMNRFSTRLRGITSYIKNHNEGHIAKIDTETKTRKKILKIAKVEVQEKYRGQKYTEQVFILLLAYLNNIKLLKDIDEIMLEYAPSVPVWTTYNRMINEFGFYNPLIDYILPNIDNNDKKVLVHETLYEFDDLYFVWSKKNSSKYEEDKKIIPEFERVMRERVVGMGTISMKFRNDKADYKKEADEIFKSKIPKKEPKEPKKKEEKKPLLSEARKRRLKQQLEQQKKDEEEMIKDNKQIYKIVDNAQKKMEVIKELKFKNLIEFKNVIVDNKTTFVSHIIQSNIDEKEHHIASISSFLDKTLLIIRYVITEYNFRGKGYTEKSFLLLWAYMNYKKYFDKIHIIKLDYAASVPVWSTYNRMINEVGFYNPLLDILNKNIDIDKKYLIHYYLLNNSISKGGAIGELYFVRKDSSEYKKLKNDYEDTFKDIIQKNLFIQTGSIVNKYALYGEPYFANKNINYEKIGKDLQKQLEQQKEASKPKPKKEPKKEESKSKPLLSEARKRRLKQQLEQQKKDEEEMIKDIKKEVKKDDNIYEIDTSSTKFKKNETEYKDLKFKGILFKNAQIKKQVLKMNGVYHKHQIIANIFKDEKREDELVHKAFIETEYKESSETEIKKLHIEMVKVYKEFRGQKLTETNFLLLWSYLNTYHKDDLNSLNYVSLQYAASVPVWTTYNRMINEIDFYNPLIDYILQRVIIDENIKLVLHYTFLQEINLYWYKKNTNDYKNFITPDFIISLIENIKDAGYELNENKKIPIEKENLQLKDNVDYKKVANEIIKQLKK